MTPTLVTSLVAIILFFGGLAIGLWIAYTVFNKAFDALIDPDNSNNFLTGMLSATRSEKIYSVLSLMLVHLYLRNPIARCYHSHGIVVKVEPE